MLQYTGIERARLVCATSLWLAFWAVPALAVDGVIEINQDCVAVGCFPGDGPGFPVTLQRGSYRLTSDLDVTNEANPEDVTAIEIFNANPLGTTLDLNGFRILGPVQCSGTPPSSCSNTGTGRGVTSNDNQVTVRNGWVQGMGGEGIRLVSGARVENVGVEGCGGNGIEMAGSGGFIVGNAVRRNGGNGIVSGTRALVSDNLAHGNGIDGLVLGVGGGYGGNVLTDNAGSDVSGSGTQIGVNVCGVAACP